MFSETRYALNGDLRVAYRASREGPRDIVFVPTWFTNCEVFPELSSIQGWVEAMTSLGRLIVLDPPATGALFAATHPSRATALIALGAYADPLADDDDHAISPEEAAAAMATMWG